MILILVLLINHTFGWICRGKSHLPCDKVLIFGRMSFAPTRPNFKIYLY
ncbi:hypothetical protein [Moraxella lacunata]